MLNEEQILHRLETIEYYSRLAAKQVLTLEDVASITGLSKSHLYKLTSTCQIPHYKKNGKILYFDRKEVEMWLKDNRVKTQEEAEQEAIAYTIKKGGIK